MKNWRTKVIVITGASSGAGRAIAMTLAKKEAILVLAARRKEALEEVAKECETFGALVHYVVTDMRKQADVDRLALEAASITGSIDIWINNAGVLAAGEFDQMPSEVIDSVIKTNLLGYMHGAHAVLPFFKEQKHGLLFNNISIGGWFPTPYAAAYTAAKFGLRGFSEALRGELLKYKDIRVIDLIPGFLDTPGIKHAANYTGKVLKPAPPVYNPLKLAEAITRLIERPESSKIVGSAAVMMKFAQAVFPTLSRNITAIVIRTYLNNAKKIENTSGNVLNPVAFGTSIHGNS
ncbi:MAG: SDR family oxidoreductase [Chitinophagaceae bacterium]|nr:MAG: SDR family oxidoreductase [Chitinophagaceae bacterium]